jgi:hypothetical protein
MTTKELIEILQKEDPSGEGHVRIGDGIIRGAESKEGYWDGPYSYLEKDKNGDMVWVESTHNYKVDIHTMDMFDFVERYNGDWKEVKNHIKVEFDYLDGGERKERFLKSVKEQCDECKEMIDSLYQKELIDMTENAKKGWKWFQNKDVDKGEKPNLHKYYTWKIYDEKGIERMSTIYNTNPILISGNWEKVDNNKKRGYYEWIFKN